MGVNISHLVLESLRDPYDQIVDNRLDSAQRRDIFTGSVVKLNIDGIFVRLGEADSKMR